MYEIIDNNGTIHSGTEDEMRRAFEVMTDSESSQEDLDRWSFDWEGDLKLIHVLDIYR